MIQLFTSHVEPKGENFSYTDGISCSWNYSEQDMIHVICFTNCDETELFINDKSYGIKQLKDCPEGYLTWIVPFTEGELKAVGRNEKQDKVTNVLSTVGSASNIRLVSIDECLKADGKDITHVIAEITDSKGQLVSSAQDEIHVVVEGGVLY